MDYYKNLELTDIVYFCEVDLIKKTEQWKNVLGYENKYLISDLGRVKSLNYNHTKKPKILKLNKNIHGYSIISLSINNIKKTHAIQQIVANSFLNHKNCGFELVVNHKDFNRRNNTLSNLEVITHRQNANRKHLKHSSKYTGVSWHKRMKKWQSRIVVKKQTIYLGTFINEDDAHNAYEEALLKIQNPSN